MTPSNANTSGLEVVAWRKNVWVADGIGTGWMLSNDQPEPHHLPTDIEPLVTAASAQARIAELEADAVRSEKHRNDLADKITSQSIELGALRSRINALNADTPHHLVLHDGTDAWCSAAAWKWFQAWSVRADEEANRATAAEARADRLAEVEGDLNDRAEACLSIVATAGDDPSKARIAGKAQAYFHAAELARAALQQETQP